MLPVVCFTGIISGKDVLVKRVDLFWEIPYNSINPRKQGLKGFHL